MLKATTRTHSDSLGLTPTEKPVALPSHTLRQTPIGSRSVVGVLVSCLGQSNQPRQTKSCRSGSALMRQGVATDHTGFTTASAKGYR